MRIHLCFFVLFATALSFAGCEEEPVGSSGSAGNQGKPCDEEQDCEDENPCTYEFCVDGSCTVDVLNGVENPEAEQTPGDCQMQGCQEGQAAVLPQNDPPEDNTNDCTTQVCEDGAVIDALLMAGEGCDFNGLPGVCDANGGCSCSAPTAGSEHYVDPVEGTDDPQHGGRFGPCAYKTLTYALTQAQGAIRLQAQVFSSMSGESPPYVLTGTQQLHCDSNNGLATLRGGGTFMSTTTVVALNGASNLVQRCIVEGQGAAHGIVFASVSTGNQHEVDECDVSGATSGISVLAAADDVRVEQNNIHNNNIGLQWMGMGKSGNIDDNAFASNMTDIVCADASPDIVGGGNGGPTCQLCMNCPF